MCGTNTLFIMTGTGLAIRGLFSAVTTTATPPRHTRLRTWYSSYRPYFLPIFLLVGLSILTSIPSYLIRYGALSQSELVEMYFWESLAVLIVPLTGITASVYGWFSKNQFWAALVGVGPYVPKLFLGIPLTFGVGIPMGFMGAGAARIRLNDRSGWILLVLGILWWSLMVISLAVS